MPERAQSFHSTGLPRNFLSCERFLFCSRIFRFKRGGRGELRRRSREAVARWAARFSARRRSNSSSRRSSASVRLRACERESCAVTLIPLGRCRRVTAVETLLTCWPPGPEERAKVSSKSAACRPSLCILTLAFAEIIPSSLRHSGGERKVLRSGHRFYDDSAGRRARVIHTRVVDRGHRDNVSAFFGESDRARNAR